MLRFVYAPWGKGAQYLQQKALIFFPGADVFEPNLITSVSTGSPSAPSIIAAIETNRDQALQHTLAFGIGIHHAGLAEGDRSVVEALFEQGKIQVQPLFPRLPAVLLRDHSLCSSACYEACSRRIHGMLARLAWLAESLHDLCESFVCSV